MLTGAMRQCDIRTRAGGSTMTDQYAALSHTRLRVGLPCHTPDGLAPLVHASDPAIRVMTDFKTVTPVTIEPGINIDTAMDKMKSAGVRLLLVPDRDDNIVGIITAGDIQGERPVKMSQALRIPHNHIRVHMLMTPLDEVMAMDMMTVRNARVGHIVVTLRRRECNYLLVVETDRPSGAQTIRGLFSISHISRLMGQDVSDPEYAAHSLAEVSHELG
jgi:signal-transduction protein with cAMP-binding, CBS, and nucleotidyltransferase domain